MKQVKITDGVYGHNVGGCIVPMTVNDPPFEVSDTAANRIVRLGVGVVLDEVAVEDTAGAVATPVEGETAPIPCDDLDEEAAGLECDDEADEAEDDEVPLYSAENTLAELKETATLLGIEVKSSWNKTVLIAKLDEYFSADDAEE